MQIPEVHYNKQLIKKITFTSVTSYLLLFALLTSVSAFTGRLADEFLSLLYVVPVGTAFICCLWAAKHSKAYKRLWRLMLFATCSWLAATIILTLYVVRFGAKNIPSPNLADILSAGFYLPFLLGVMFSLGRIRRPFDLEKKQFLTNTSMLALAAFLLLYKFILVPAWYLYPNYTTTEKIFTVANPLLDWVIFVSIAVATRRFQGSQIEGWIILLTLAPACSIISDIPIHILGYQMNIFAVLFMSIAAILMAMAAIDEVTGAFLGIRNRARAKTNDVTDMQILKQNPWQTIIIPFSSVVVIPITWVAYSIHGVKQEVPVAGAVSMLILFLLIYGNHLQLSDNAILLAKTLRDGLTGLHNHRYFQEALDKAISKADKTKKPVSLFVLDIDNLSEINNQYGHFFGDKVLTTIGAAITSKTREDDEACRLSGDEFGVILPKTGQDRALTIATRIKNHIKNHMEKTLAGAFPDKDITVTIGLSTYPTLAKDKDELLHTADGALYWGKLQGKNNVLTYDPQVVEALSAEERTKRVEEAALLDLVKTLVTAVDAKDEYTGLHSNGVSDMAGKLARQIGLDEEAINRVEVAGMLHDVGKIGMPDSILNKPSRLTDDEMAIIKTHPELSAQIINSTSLKDVVPAVRSHHERWDGNGYPNGLKGKQIPLEARILAIADTYDAMITDRPYRKGLPVDDAITEIKRSAGTQLDPELVGHFLALFSYRNTKKRSAAAREKRPEANCKVVANS